MLRGSVRSRWGLFEEGAQVVIHRPKAVNTFAHTLADDVCLAKGERAFKGIFEFVELGGECYQSLVGEEIFVPESYIELDAEVI